jgi:hypothetical protein
MKLVMILSDYLRIIKKIAKYERVLLQLKSFLEYAQRQGHIHAETG